MNEQQLLLVDELAGIPPLSNDDWYTPRWIFDAAALTFDIDVAAPIDVRMRTCPARRFFTLFDDGLTQPWDGLVWCNPPYSRVTPWVDRWIVCDGGMMLVPAAARVKWRRRVLLHSDALLLVDGTFIRPNGSSSFPYALMLVARGRVAIEALGRVADVADDALFTRIM